LQLVRDVTTALAQVRQREGNESGKCFDDEMVIALVSQFAPAEVAMVLLQNPPATVEDLQATLRRIDLAEKDRLYNYGQKAGAQLERAPPAKKPRLDTNQRQKPAQPRKEISAEEKCKLHPMGNHTDKECRAQHPAEAQEKKPETNPFTGKPRTGKQQPKKKGERFNSIRLSPEW
jgi:hypothetical protein